MTRDDADKLAETMFATWPSGPRKYIWMQVLEPLTEATTARQTYERLRASDHHAPSAARFLEHYRIERRTQTERRPKPAIPAAPTMSLDEYLAGVAARAEAGDVAAVDELAVWTKVRARPTGTEDPEL